MYSLGSYTSCSRERRVFTSHSESSVKILPGGRNRLVVVGLDELLQLLHQIVVTETLSTGVVEVTIGNVYFGVKCTTNMPSYNVSNRELDLNKIAKRFNKV